MSAMSSLHRLIFSFKTFVFCFLLFFLSGCATTPQECPTNPNAKYEYELIKSHVSEMLSGESKKFKRWEGPIRYLLVGFSDDKSISNLKRQAQEISKYTGISILPRQVQKDTNVYLIFPGDLNEVYQNKLVQSIYMKALGYSEKDFLRMKLLHIETGGGMLLETATGEDDSYVFTFLMTQYKNYSYEDMERIFLLSLYSVVVDFSPANIISPSITNTFPPNAAPKRLNDFDRALLKAFYQKNLRAGDDKRKAVSEIACAVHSSLIKN